MSWMWETLLEILFREHGKLLPSHLNSLILLSADVTVKHVLSAFLISIEQMVRFLV